MWFSWLRKRRSRMSVQITESSFNYSVCIIHIIARVCVHHHWPCNRKTKCISIYLNFQSNYSVPCKPNWWKCPHFEWHELISSFLSLLSILRACYACPQLEASRLSRMARGNMQDTKPKHSPFLWALKLFEQTRSMLYLSLYYLSISAK